jgi:signal transduction histidine kinase
MDKIHQLQRALPASRRLPLVALILTLVVLAATIAFTTRRVRTGIRDQLCRRDAEVLHAVAVLLVDEGSAEATLAGPVTEPANQLLVILQASRLRGVLGTRLFDTAGRFVEAFPPNVREAGLDASDLTGLRGLRPVARFHAGTSARDLFYPDAGARPAGELFPVLEVNVPLHTSGGDRLLGIAQFLLEGHSLAAEFDQLDRQLGRQAVSAFVVASLILTAGIGWAFRQLGLANRQLAARSADLLQANQELALAARTTALGAITSHLIHGLKNPLAGLQNFVATAGQTPGPDPTPDWQQAVASTRHLQAMVAQIVNVLHEEETRTQYELTLAELGGIIASRALPLARDAGVQFLTERRAEGVLTNRVANLVTLILANLIQNAVQATPAGRTVTLEVTSPGAGFRFEVRDEGPGFPAALRDNPFAPRRSGKEGGAGIGLAISKQLANHLGATLRLEQSSPRGCVFALEVPARPPARESGRAEPARIC